jgi:hypothetical protein
MEKEDVLGKVNLLLKHLPQSLDLLQYGNFKSKIVPMNPYYNLKNGHNMCLLLSDLHPTPEHSRTFLHKIWANFRDFRLWSLLGTSGMGKTHKAFEFLSVHEGIYLSSAVPSAANFGSLDMTYFLERLEQDKISNDPAQHAENVKYVTRFMQCILLARLLVRGELFIRHDFNPHNWLIFQLFPFIPNPENPDQTIDIFKSITILLRSLPEFVLTELIEENLPSSTIPIFLDEAQVLCHKYQDCFTFNQTRPLYSAVCRALALNQKTSICTIGTGLALSTITKLNESDTFKTILINERPIVGQDRNAILSFRYETATQVRNYLLQYMDIPNELDYICHWLIGRPRIAASFIEHVFMVTRRDGQFTHTDCHRFLSAMVSEDHGGSLCTRIRLLNEGQRSLKDSRDIFKLMTNLKNAVDGYMYSGNFSFVEDAEMFEQGFGILLKASDPLSVIVCEPVVIRAAYNYFYGETLSLQMPLTLMSLFANNDSALGHIFEMIAPVVIQRLFDLDTFQQINAFGQQLWNGLKLLGTRLALTPSCRTESAKYKLQDHLINPSCLLLSLDKYRGADFGASVVLGSQVVGEITLQVKFRKDFNQSQAMLKSTYEPFTQRKDQLRIRLLFAYPKKTKYQLSKVEPGLITLIIDSRNIEYFITEKGAIEFFDMLKSKGQLDYLESLDDMCRDMGMEETN